MGTKPDEVCANVIKALKEPAKARRVEGNKLYTCRYCMPAVALCMYTISYTNASEQVYNDNYVCND